MIKLDVAAYCHNCSHFEPENFEVPAYYSCIDGRDIMLGDYVIRCKDADKCSTVYEYLNRRKEELDDPKT